MCLNASLTVQACQQEKQNKIQENKMRNTRTQSQIDPLNDYNTLEAKAPE